MPRKPPDDTTRSQAWIGDAVLSLFAREWILNQHSTMDGESLSALTSNQFLANFGNPTEVEAEIGRLYQSQGLEAAFNWIETRFLPLAMSQLKNRQQQSSKRRQ